MVWLMKVSIMQKLEQERVVIFRPKGGEFNVCDVWRRQDAWYGTFLTKDEMLQLAREITDMAKEQ